MVVLKPFYPQVCEVSEVGVAAQVLEAKRWKIQEASVQDTGHSIGQQARTTKQIMCPQIMTHSEI